LNPSSQFRSRASKSSGFQRDHQQKIPKNHQQRASVCTNRSSSRFHTHKHAKKTQQDPPKGQKLYIKHKLLNTHTPQEIQYTISKIYINGTHKTPLTNTMTPKSKRGEKQKEGLN